KEPGQRERSGDGEGGGRAPSQRRDRKGKKNAAGEATPAGTGVAAAGDHPSGGRGDGARVRQAELAGGGEQEIRDEACGEDHGDRPCRLRLETGEGTDQEKARGSRHHRLHEQMRGQERTLPEIPPLRLREEES